MSETIVAVDRALDILLTLYNNGEEMGISEISRELDLHKSSVHRTLVTLENKNFVHQNLNNGKYWLGVKIYTMGLLVGEKISMVDIFKPYSKELFNEFNEVVNISILDKDITNGYKSVIVLKEYDENKVLSVNPDAGSVTDARASSVGKCLLAFSKYIDYNKLLEKPLEKYTEYTITNHEDLFNELRKIKEEGYAIDNEERELGLTCIGAPILDKNGYAVAAISISGPSARMKINNFDEKVKKVKDIANKISAAMK